MDNPNTFYLKYRDVNMGKEKWSIAVIPFEVMFPSSKFLLGTENKMLICTACKSATNLLVTQHLITTKQQKCVVLKMAAPLIILVVPLVNPPNLVKNCGVH